MFSFTPEFEEQMRGLAAEKGEIVAISEIRKQSRLSLAQAKIEFERIVGHPTGHAFQRNDDGTVNVTRDGVQVGPVEADDTFEDGTPLPGGWTRYGVHYESERGRVFVHGDGYNIARGPRRLADVSNPADVTHGQSEMMAERKRLLLALDGLNQSEVEELVELREMRIKARSYLLPDEALDADARATIQHDTASAILNTVRPTTLDRLFDAGLTALQTLEDRIDVPPGYGLPTPRLLCYGVLAHMIESEPNARNFLEAGFTYLADNDQPKTVMVTVQRMEGRTPGQMITDLKAEVARLQAERDEAVAARDKTLQASMKEIVLLGQGEEERTNLAVSRMRAVYLAEIGRQAPEGWAWNRTHGHWEKTYSDGHKAEVWPSSGSDVAGFAIRRQSGEEILLHTYEDDPNPIWEGGTDALDGMETIDRYATKAGWITPACKL